MGEALSLKMAAAGIGVFAIGSDSKKLRQLEQRYPGAIKAIAYDLSEPNSWQDITSVLKGFRLNYLVHADSPVGPVGKLELTDYQLWKKAMVVNLDAPLFLTKSLSNGCLYSDSRVLFVSSVGAHVPIGGAGSYCISKAALEMARKVLSLESKPYLLASFSRGFSDSDLYECIMSSSGGARSSAAQMFDLRDKNDLAEIKPCVDFIHWILTGTSNEVYADNTWDYEDPDQHQMWADNPSLNHGTKYRNENFD